MGANTANIEAAEDLTVETSVQMSVESARLVLGMYGISEEGLCDLLADLMHLCVAEGIDFFGQLEDAASAFNAENDFHQSEEG